MAIFAITNFKGGVGKTSAAVCLGALLASDGDTLLIDADQNQSALIWAGNGEGLPFEVVPEKASQKATMGRNWQHVIIDSQIAPGTGEARALMEGSDLLIVPTTPDGPALSATARLFAELKAEEETEGNAIALITMTPPKPQKDGAEASEALAAGGIPSFTQHIRHGKAYKRAFESGATLGAMGSQLRAGALWRDWLNLKPEVLAAAGVK